MRVVPGKRRYRFHGGMSTGPKTKAGRARIAEATATALEGISVAQILWLCHDFGVRPHDARTRVPAYTSSAPQEGVETIPRGGDFFMSALARAERAKARTPPLAKGRPGGPAPTLGWA